MPDPLAVFDDHVLGLVWAELDVRTRFVAASVSRLWRLALDDGWRRVVMRSSGVADDRKAFYVDLERGGGVVDWRRLAITHSVTDARWAACRARERWVTAPSHCVDYLSPTFHDVYNGTIVYVSGGNPGGFGSFSLDTGALTTAAFDVPADTLDAQDVRGGGVAFLRGDEVYTTRGTAFKVADVAFDPRIETTYDAHCAGGEYATFRFVVGPNRDGVFRAVRSGVHGAAKLELQLPYDMPYARMCPDAEFIFLYGASLAVFTAGQHMASVHFNTPAPIGALYDLATMKVVDDATGAPIRVCVQPSAAADEAVFPRGIAEITPMDGGVLVLRGAQGDIVLIRDYARVFRDAAGQYDAVVRHSTLLKTNDAVAVHTHGPRLLVVTPQATVCIDTRDLTEHNTPLPLIVLPTPNHRDHRPLPLPARATLDNRGIYQTVPLRGLRKDAYVAASETDPGMLKWQPEWDAAVKKRPYFAIRAWSFEPEAAFPA